MSEVVRRARMLLGTVFEISVESTEAHRRDEIDAQLNRAFGEAARLEKLLSYYDPESDVSRINREPNRVGELASETIEVLAFAERLRQRTTGRFDVSCGAALIRYGYLPAIGDTTVPQQKIDLGGIAKGFIVDRVFEQLSSEGVASLVVNAGGDLRFRSDEARSIAIRRPDCPEMYSQILQFQSAAIATSAAYYSGRIMTERDDDGGERVMSPLVNPLTGQCVEQHDSISVVASTCMVADALTKVAALCPNYLEIFAEFGAGLLIQRASL